MCACFIFSILFIAIIKAIIKAFWKRDSYAKTSLPNFADDLNLHKNPNVRKSSTVNIINDSFSSLDNNFLKWTGSEQPFISKSSNFDSISNSTSVNKYTPKDFTISISKIKYCLTSSTGIQGKTLQGK